MVVLNISVTCPPTLYFQNLGGWHPSKKLQGGLVSMKASVYLFMAFSNVDLDCLSGFYALMGNH